MMDLNDFLFFVSIVDSGGFTAASRSLGVPKSTLSHRMTKLEAGLEVRLLTRSSRHVGMTEAGRDFYRHSVGVLREADMAQTVVRQRLAEPSGVVRCTAASATMHFAMADIIASFLAKHPKVSIVAHSTDKFVDIIKENFDVALRGHSDPLPDSELVQRTLATSRRSAASSPMAPTCTRPTRKGGRRSTGPAAATSRSCILLSLLVLT